MLTNFAKYTDSFYYFHAGGLFTVTFLMSIHFLVQQMHSFRPKLHEIISFLIAKIGAWPPISEDLYLWWIIRELFVPCDGYLFQPRKVDKTASHISYMYIMEFSLLCVCCACTQNVVRNEH